MKIIVANWKNYVQDFKTARRLFELYKDLVSYKKDLLLIVSPPTVYLKCLSDLYKGKKISFCAQEINSKSPNTGVLTFAQAKDARAEFFITGHKEQRERKKTDEDINEEILQSINQKLFPILIVGENARANNAEHFKFVAKQLKDALKNYPKNKAVNFIVAYEPVWAVGSGKSARLNEIEMMALYIKKTLVSILGDKRGRKVPILYGGSLNRSSFRAVLDIEHIDGIVLGRASANFEEIKEILSNI